MRSCRSLAQRDVVTGLPNTRAFERAIDRRLASRAPFALLVGDFDAMSFPEDHDEGMRLLADALRGVLGPDTDLARVGADELAVLTACDGLEQAAQLAVRLERTLCETGALVTFGWSAFPREGRRASPCTAPPTSGSTRGGCCASRACTSRTPSAPEESAPDSHGVSSGARRGSKGCDLVGDDLLRRVAFCDRRCAARLRRPARPPARPARRRRGRRGAVGPLAWNAILRDVDAPGFFVDAPGSPCFRRVGRTPARASSPSRSAAVVLGLGPLAAGPGRRVAAAALCSAGSPPFSSTSISTRPASLHLSRRDRTDWRSAPGLSCG